MPEAELPSGIVAQFRATSIERLGRIEDAWSSLTQRVATAESESDLFHDVHTLKGEARLVGFADVVLITQRLRTATVIRLRHERVYRITSHSSAIVIRYERRRQYLGLSQLDRLREKLRAGVGIKAHACSQC